MSGKSTSIRKTNQAPKNAPKTKQKEEAKVLRESIVKPAAKNSMRKNEAPKPDKGCQPESKKTKEEEKSEKNPKNTAMKKTIYKKDEKVSPGRGNVDKKSVKLAKPAEAKPAAAIKPKTTKPAAVVKPGSVKPEPAKPETTKPVTVKPDATKPTDGKSEKKPKVVTPKVTTESCINLKIKPRVVGASFTKLNAKPKAIAESVGTETTIPTNFAPPPHQIFAKPLKPQKADNENKKKDSTPTSPEIGKSTITLYKSIIISKSSLSDFQAVDKVDNLPRLPTKVVVIKKGVPEQRPKEEKKEEEKFRPFVVAEVKRPPKISVSPQQQQQQHSQQSKNTQNSITSAGSLEMGKAQCSSDDLTNISTPLSDLSLDISKLAENQLPDEEFRNNDLSPIFKEEFESFYEHVKEMNQACKILKDSYRCIVASLINLSKRKTSTTTATGKKTMNMMTTMSEMKMSHVVPDETTAAANLGTEIKVKKTLGSLEGLPALPIDERLTNERFINPETRDEAFENLFKEVDTLNKDISKLKEFYDQDGCFLYEEYNASNYKIDRVTFDLFRQKITMLTKLIKNITSFYNRDLLGLYRL